MSSGGEGSGEDGGEGEAALTVMAIFWLLPQWTVQTMKNVPDVCTTASYRFRPPLPPPITTKPPRSDAPTSVPPEASQAS